MSVCVGVVCTCVLALSQCVLKMMWTAHSQVHSTLSPSAGAKISHCHLRMGRICDTRTVYNERPPNYALKSPKCVRLQTKVRI